MKLMHVFETLATLTSSGDASGFPAANVKDLDPGIYWKADNYASTDKWLKIDFGSAKALAAVFLNRCNFPHCHIQGHATDSWASPSFDLGVDLVRDDALNRKGWFDLTGFNYRWLRILIPLAQTLDDTIAKGTPDTLPLVGNVIAGPTTTGVVTLPLVSDLNPRMVQAVGRFVPDGGGLTKWKKGKASHVIALSIGDTLANIRAMPKSWDIGVVAADLGNAGEAWLVYPADDWNRPVRSVIDASLSFTLEEKP